MNELSFWYTILLIIGLSIVLAKEYIEADIAVFSTLVLLLIGGVINLKEAFAGFSNHGMLTVAFLYIISSALKNTGALNNIGERLLGANGTITENLLRLLFPVSAISAFLNNTPVILMLTQAVKHWAKKKQIPITKYLIPLSYSAILGGTCTLIGTSTTLVVHGLMLEKGLKGMSFFEISKIGIPVTFFGVLIISFIGHKVLPSRIDPIEQMGEQVREFVVVMRVDKNYKYKGCSIEEAGLRHLKGLFLFQIDRKGEVLSPVRPEEKLEEFDLLFFTGLPDTILEIQKTEGLILLKNAPFDLKNYDSDQVRHFEVVISSDSPLNGKNVRESNFRSKYSSVIIAIHRSGERIQMKVGDIIFQAGDTLLILAKHDFLKKWYHSKDFFLVSKSIDALSKPKWHSFFSASIVLLMIISMASGLIPILASVSLASVILVVSGVITPYHARRSLDLKVLLIIASAFGIANGLDNSGLAFFIADNIIKLTGSYGPLGMLIAIYFLTSIYTEIITNNAAAALLVPIVISATSQAGYDTRPFLLAVAMGASASFATPIGYQTNLIVYGPGGYKFKDFLKIGIPMNIIIGVIAIALIYIFYF